MRDRCNYADQYQAKIPPQCGCKACGLKWIDAQVQRLVDLKALDDFEAAHEQADNIMSDFIDWLGFPEVSRAYIDVPKWYS